MRNNMLRFLTCLPVISSCFLTSCTLSFQNVSTHGTATDLIDENQAASPTVSTDIKAQVPGLPLRR